MILIKTILITGASSGIGAALSLRYASPTTLLILQGRNEKRLKAIAFEAELKGARVITKLLDLRESQNVETWIKETHKTHPINLAFLNAGISNSGAPETRESIQKIFDVNVQGLLNTLLPLLECFEAQKCGQIAIMSSLASFKGFRFKGAYCGSKAAVRVLGEGLRESYASKGIKISVICPGFVKTPLTDCNQFKMPFLMSPEKAADKIFNGLERNKARISFPWPLAFGAWVMSTLPPSFTESLSRFLPYK